MTNSGVDVNGTVAMSVKFVSGREKTFYSEIKEFSNSFRSRQGEIVRKRKVLTQSKSGGDGMKREGCRE